MLATATLSTIGCFFNDHRPSFDRLEFSDISLSPAKVSLDPHRVLVAQGIAVKAHVIAFDSDGTQYESLHLTSSDPNVVGVEPGPNADSWIFYGVNPGETSIRVTGGGPAGSVSAQVVTQ